MALEKGQIITGSNELTVNNADKSAVIGYSEESYVRGNLRRQVKSTGSYDFPLGTASNYEFTDVLPSKLFVLNPVFTKSLQCLLPIHRERCNH